MANYDASIRIGTLVDTSQMNSLWVKIDKAVDKVEELTEKQKEFATTQIPTSEYVEIQTQISKAEDNMQKLIEKKEKLTATGGTPKAITNLNYDIEQARNTITYAKAELEDLVSNGKAFTPGVDSDEYRKVSKELELAKRNLEAFKTKQNEIESKQKKVTKAFEDTAHASRKALKSVSDNTSKANNLIGVFSKRVWGLAKRIFVFSLIARAFRSMVNGIKEGLQNFAKYNKEYNATMSAFKSATAQFKNALGVAIAPLIQSIVSGLTLLVNALIDCINAYNKFIAVVSGKSTFTVAKKQQIDYAKSLDNTSKSASKTKGELADFDEIEVLKKNEGAGDLSEGLNAEEVQNKLDPILKELDVLKEKFKEGFESGKGDKSFEERFARIKKSIEGIKKALSDIWNDPNVKRSSKNFAETVAKSLGQITGASASIGLTVAENLTGGIQEYLERDKGRISEALANLFDINASTFASLGNVAESIARIFEPFGEVVGKSLTSNILGAFSSALLGFAQLSSKFTRDFTNIMVKPIIDNTEKLRKNFDSLLGVFDKFAESVRKAIEHAFDSLNKVYDKHFKPFYDAIAEGTSRFVSIFSDVFESNIVPVLNKVGDVFDELLNDAIMPMFDETLNLVGNLMDVLGALWTNVLVPIVSWVIENIVPIASEVIGMLVSAVGGLASVIVASVTLVTDILNTILRFIASGFKNGWKSAFEDLAKNFDTVWNGMKDTVKHYVNIIIGFVQNMVDRIVDGINAIVDVLNKALSFTIPDWVPGLGGKSWSVNLPHVASVKIPMLSEGAVIPPNRKFLAMLGDQTSGVNVEAPLDTIKQAVAEVVGNNGASNVNIRFTGSLAELGRVLKPVIDTENTRIGTSFEVV